MAFVGPPAGPPPPPVFAPGLAPPKMRPQSEVRRSLKANAMSKSEKMKLKPVSQFPGKTIGERVAAKNAASRFFNEAFDYYATDDVVDSILAQVQENGEITQGGGSRRRQKGGDWLSDTGASIAERYNFAKAVTMMVVYTSGGWAGDALEAAAGPSKEYITREIVTPLLGTGTRLALIALKVADQLIIKTPVTVLIGTAATVGAVGNFAGELLRIFNTWGRNTSAALLDDKTAADAAAAAVASTKAAVMTGAVAVGVAQQLGLLPLSAILAAILFSLQINLGTGGGRAYVAASLYRWYVMQTPEAQMQIKAAATQYAQSTRAAASSGAEASKEAARAAAATLGPLLASAAAGGANAFQTVAQSCSRPPPGGPEPAPAVVPPPTTGDGAGAALVEGAPAASIAAAAEGATSVEEGPRPAKKAVKKASRGRLPAEVANAPEFVPAPAAVGAPGDGDAAMGKGGRRKTKKVKSKRRVTRRRKATKVLGTPVFIY